MRNTLSRLWQMFPGQRYAYFISLGLAATAKALGEVFVAVTLGGLIDAAVGLDITLLMQVLARFIVGFALLMLFSALTRIWFESAVARMTGKLRQAVFEHVLQLQMSQFEDYHSGELHSRLANDIQTGSRAYGDSVYNVAETLIWALASTVYLFAAAWQMALAVCILGLTIMQLNRWLAVKQRALSRTVQTARGKHMMRISDLLLGHKVIRFFGIQSHIQGFAEKDNDILLEASLGRAEHAAKASAVNELSSNLSFLGLVVVGAWLSLRGHLSVGTVVVALQLQTGTSELFLNIGKLIFNLQEALAGLDRIWELLDTPTEPQGQRQLSAIPEKVEIEFRSVDFSYDGKTPVLKDVSFAVTPGKTFALVGPSGSGKSTILKLLLGYYQPQAGSILINGQDIAEFNKGELRKCFAVVPQRTFLFTGSIAHNVGLGRKGATTEEILDALEIANAQTFVNEQQAGLETLVGPDGTGFSDGEKQRLAIARAVVRNAPVLLLDEPTSALDSESERLLQGAMSRLRAGRTCLVIAHRLWTINTADKILVLDNGRLVAQGSHDELMKQPGVYRELVLAGIKSDTA
ncbi:MAG TPA: ABC transporter ATP-binding protein [Firmicutes bacterium]|nr:ABC transporter ATP-binding protein [Candidatus Fermentithermobacillaceae bacterium]